MKNKTFIIFFFIGSFFIFSSLPIFNYLNDRWRVLHSDYENFYKGIEPNKTFLKEKYLLENKEKYDTLLMGSSRMGNLDSKLLSKKAYNMTYSFGHIYTHLNNLKILLDHKVKIKKIILGIDDFYLFQNPEVFETEYLRRSYKDDYIGKIDFYRFYLFKKPTDTDIDTFFKKYPIIKSSHITNPGDMSERIDAEKRINNDLNSHKNNFKNPLIFGYNEIFRTDQVLQEIKQFKELCELNNIELIVVMFPQFYNNYLAYNQDEIEKFKRGLVKITKFYDFYFLSDDSFDEKLWFSPSHFTPTIGNKILYDIFENKNLVTADNIDEKIKNYKILYAKSLERVLDKEGDKIIKLYNLELKDSNLIFDISKDAYSKNDQLKIIVKGKNTELTVIKNDPIIILNQTKTSSKNVILNYEVNSPIDTSFQIFYKKEKNANYNELDSYRVAIKKGINKMTLVIPSEYINNDLRLALVSSVGRYEIRELKIYAKE